MWPGRLKNRFVAKLATRFQWIADRLVHSDVGQEASVVNEYGPVPWSPPRKALNESGVALVTTAGVHHSWQKPFDMHDPDGDPSSREIDASRQDLIITHDYYDHADADRDLNIVFPLERLREFAAEGVIGDVSPVHFGFMGHITGKHVGTLVEQTAPEAARRLREAGVDIVVLTPG